jgi:hypothetical protein
VGVSVPNNTNLPLLADLATGTELAPAMDSDAAVARTEALGGAAYRQQTGAEVRSMDLMGFAGGPLEWSVFYTKPFTDHQATLRIDAQSGDLIAVEGDDFGAPRTP